MQLRALRRPAQAGAELCNVATWGLPQMRDPIIAGSLKMRLIVFCWGPDLWNLHFDVQSGAVLLPLVCCALTAMPTDGHHSCGICHDC